MSSEVLCEKLDALNEDNWEQLEKSNSFTTRSHHQTEENHHESTMKMKLRHGVPIPNFAQEATLLV